MSYAAWGTTSASCALSCATRGSSRHFFPFPFPLPSFSSVLKPQHSNLRHDLSTPLNRFRQGNYSTKFIPTEYPDGFKGVELTRRETHELVATAVALHHARLDVAASGTDEGAGEDVDGHNPNTLVSGDELVALLPSGEAFHVTVSIEDSLVVDLVPLDPAHPSLIPRSRRAAERVEVSQLDWVCETPLATLTFMAEVKADVGAKRASKKKKGAGTEAEAGPLQEERIVQYEGRVPQGYKLRFNGSQQTVLLRSLRQHALSVHMLPPENVDVTRFLLCPMPGTLVSCAVKEGQEMGCYTPTDFILPGGTVLTGVTSLRFAPVTGADLLSDVEQMEILDQAPDQPDGIATPLQVGLIEVVTAAPVGTPTCDTIDFNNNGVFPEDQDVVDFFDVLAGGNPATCDAALGCQDVDFNNNGVFPEDQDVIDFFNVLAGGACP